MKCFEGWKVVYKNGDIEIGSDRYCYGLEVKYWLIIMLLNIMYWFN